MAFRLEPVKELKPGALKSPISNRRLSPIVNDPPGSPRSTSSSSSSSSESTLSLPDGQGAQLPSSPEVSYVPQPRIQLPTEQEKPRERKPVRPPTPAGRNEIGVPDLPAYADTNGSDNTAVAPELRVARRTFTIRKSGESGRVGFHPFLFLRIMLQSSSFVSKMCNFLWPLVPVAIVLQHVDNNQKLLVFIFSYLAVLPCANLIGFSGGELARKLPHVLGIMVNTICESLTEIILIMVLLRDRKFGVIQAAILGSILATMLLCLGLCFFIGGLRRDEQVFSDTVTEAGSGLLLAGGVALAVPTIFYHSLASNNGTDIAVKTRDISRIIAILLLIAYFVYIFFQSKSHHGALDAVFEEQQKEWDTTYSLHQRKHKFTMTECCVGLCISITLVTILSIGLVGQIGYIVENYKISDPFLGLILIPLCEKAAEHLTAVEESWENRTNFALSHVLNATLQTALFTAPLAVIVGWGLNYDMDFNFEIFNIAMLILGIIAVGGFMRDQKSNYLEGFLCLVIYAAIAIAAYYYPNPTDPHSE